MKYIVYKITNIVNNNIYIGIHTTDNINDRYMGSGTNIKLAIKEYGKHNFKKEILYVYDNEVDMLNKESELVNENFIKREDTYNIIKGGGTFLTTGCVSVRDKDDNTFMVNIDDPRYLSGELIHSSKGISNTTSIGMVVTKDIFDNIHRVSVDDPRYLSGELVPFNKNNVTVKDKDGGIFNVSVDDPRYLSGELVFYQKGYKRSKYTKNKISKSLIGNKRRLGIKHTDESKKKMSNSLKGRKAPNKMEIYQMDLDGNIIRKWESIKKASEELKLFNISEAISGNRKTCGGFKWTKV